MVEIEIYDENDVFQGESPIMGDVVVECDYGAVLNELAEFSFRIPAADEHARYCVYPYYVKIYVQSHEEDVWSREYVFHGKITKNVIELGTDGVPYCVVSGLSEGTELSERITHANFGNVSQQTGQDIYDAPARLLAEYTDFSGKQWALDADGETETLYNCGLNSNHQLSTYEMLTQVAEDTRGNFLVLPDRKIRWINDVFQESGLYACYLDYYDKDDLPSEILPIKSVTLEHINDFIISRVYALDKDGNWMRPFTPPAGYSIATVADACALTRDATVARYGLIEVFKHFSEAATQEGIQRAARNFLDNNSEIQHVYSLEVANLKPNKLFPGQTLRIDYDGIDGNNKYLSIHDDLVVLSVSYSIGPDQQYNATIELSETTRKIIGDGDVISLITQNITDSHAIF